jgi:ABC-2 type transport system permease protein
VLKAAKAAVVTDPAGTIASVGAGRAAHPAGHGLADPPLSLGNGADLRAALGSALYLARIALGVATLVRDSAAAIGIMLGLLYLFPILAATVTDPAWHRHLQQIGPMTAGLAIQATTGLNSLPISPWAGLGVLAAWAAAALLLGGLLFRLRDA